MPNDVAVAWYRHHNLTRLRELIAEAQRPLIDLRTRALMEQIKESLKRTGVTL